MNYLITPALMGVMSAMLATQFESFAECCSELARAAETPARRARLVQMAHEYRRASSAMAPRSVSNVEHTRPLPPRRAHFSPALAGLFLYRLPKEPGRPGTPAGVLLLPATARGANPIGCPCSARRWP